MSIIDRYRKAAEKDCFSVSTFNCKRDELVIYGTEYRPEGDNLPVAIVCHGFMAWQDTVRQYAMELAQMGFCAYCFDFCGGSVLKKGKSDGATTDMSVLTEVQDLEAVIEYAQSMWYGQEDSSCDGGWCRVNILISSRRRCHSLR